MKTKKRFIISFVIALSFLITVLSNGYAKDLKQFKPKMDKVSSHWKKILADQKKLIKVMKGIKNKNQLNAKKQTIITLRNQIDKNAKYRRSIMKRLPEKQSVRLNIAKKYTSQNRKYKQNRKRFFDERRRIKKLPGCKSIILDIDKKHKSNKRTLISKLKREGKMWKKNKKAKKKKSSKSKKPGKGKKPKRKKK